MKLQMAVVFAKELSTLTAFYRDGLGLSLVSESETWVELDAGGTALGLHAIPPAIAASIVITTPPARREETPIKLVFAVDSLDDAVARAVQHGAIMDPPTSWGACDGLDPEGNVFQLVPAAKHNADEV